MSFREARDGASPISTAGAAVDDRAFVRCAHGVTLDLTGGPLVMGIVNATPDSFSDRPGAKSLEDRVALARRLVDEGADLIDVGGESGVTDRPPVDPAVEIARVVPLIERIAELGVPISVDTYKPDVARAAITAGAHLINDVSGLADERLADIAATAGAGLVLMHTRAAPKRKLFPGYDDGVVADVLEFLAERIALSVRRGVDITRLIVDPGPDFAKTPAESVAVLRAIGRLRAELGRPVLLAVSRKDFVGAVTGRAPRDRLGGSLAALAAGVSAGAAIVRVHDVAETRDFLAVRAVLSGDTAVDGRLRLAPGLLRTADTSDLAATESLRAVGRGRR